MRSLSFSNVLETVPETVPPAKRLRTTAAAPLAAVNAVNAVKQELKLKLGPLPAVFGLKAAAPKKTLSKRCTCKKSRCLKRYCECFRAARQPLPRPIPPLAVSGSLSCLGFSALLERAH